MPAKWNGSNDSFVDNYHGNVIWNGITNVCPNRLTDLSNPAVLPSLVDSVAKTGNKVVCYSSQEPTIPTVKEEEKRVRRACFPLLDRRHLILGGD